MLSLSGVAAISQGCHRMPCHLAPRTLIHSRPGAAHRCSGIGGFPVRRNLRQMPVPEKKNPEGQGKPSGRGKTDLGRDRTSGCTQGDESTRTALRASGNIDRAWHLKVPVTARNDLSAVHARGTGMDGCPIQPSGHDGLSAPCPSSARCPRRPPAVRTGWPLPTCVHARRRRSPRRHRRALRTPVRRAPA